MAAGRMALGAGLVVAPGLTGRIWFGRDGGAPAARALAVAMGARDLALGAGTAHAAETGAPIRPWLVASMVGDAADLLVTQRHRAVVPWPARVGVSVLAAGAVAAGAWLARRAEDVTPEAIITPR
jgi:hypothetical protein